jgi:hypothetical protein
MSIPEQFVTCRVDQLQSGKLGTDAEQELDSRCPQLVMFRVSELCPYPSYLKHKLSVPASRIDALDRLGNRAFQDPILVTQDRLIIDGYARWELAKKRGMATILCLVYQRTEDEALRDFLWRHRRLDGLNDFTLSSYRGTLNCSYGHV